jgi:dTDP-4-amino-4,6-dideoxygalactose transaminase
MGPNEESLVLEALAFYRDSDVDPGYQGEFEARYCREFCTFMGGGYADAVATGTAALFVAIAALQLPRGSDVLVSPITDPGTISAIILNGLRPKLMDSGVGSFNIDEHSVASRIDNRTSAVVVVHNFGRAVDMGGVMRVANPADVRVIEDCSQSHGAESLGQRVGSFGDIAAFSTMYRKIHITGGSGGVVYTTDKALHHLALAYADRGKPRWRSDFDDRDPRGYLFPALNLHSNELSCAIGIASIARLDHTLSRRRAFIRSLVAGLNDGSTRFTSWLDGEDDSPFVAPIMVEGPIDVGAKTALATQLRDRGVDLNPHYRYLVRDWPWAIPELADDFDTTNARQALAKSFMLYLNENYGQDQADFILQRLYALDGLKRVSVPGKRRS